MTKTLKQVADTLRGTLNPDYDHLHDLANAIDAHLSKPSGGAVSEEDVAKAMKIWLARSHPHAPIELGYTDNELAGMRAALESLQGARVPDGWKLVPVDPTDYMVSCYVAAVNEHLGGLTKEQWQEERRDHAASVKRVACIGIRAMLAASPPADSEA